MVVVECDSGNSRSRTGGTTVSATLGTMQEHVFWIGNAFSLVCPIGTVGMIVFAGRFDWFYWFYGVIGIGMRDTPPSLLFYILWRSAGPVTVRGVVRALVLLFVLLGWYERREREK